MLPNVGSKEHSSCHHQLFPRLAKVNDVNSLHSASEDIAWQAKSGLLLFQQNIESLQYVVEMVDTHLLVLLVTIMCALPSGRMTTLDCLGFRSGQLISLDLPPKSMLVLPLSSSRIFVGVNILEPIHKHDSYAWQEKTHTNSILTLCRSHHHWHKFGVSQNF